MEAVFTELSLSASKAATRAGDHKKAYEYFRGIAPVLKNAYGMAYAFCLADAGEAAIRAGTPLEAAKCFAEAVRCAEKNGNDTLAAEYAARAAEQYKHAEESEQSEQYFKKSAALAERSKAGGPNPAAIWRAFNTIDVELQQAIDLWKSAPDDKKKDALWPAILKLSREYSVFLSRKARYYAWIALYIRHYLAYEGYAYNAPKTGAGESRDGCLAAAEAFQAAARQGRNLIHNDLDYHVVMQRHATLRTLGYRKGDPNISLDLPAPLHKKEIQKCYQEAASMFREAGRRDKQAECYAECAAWSAKCQDEDKTGGLTIFEAPVAEFCRLADGVLRHGDDLVLSLVEISDGRLEFSNECAHKGLFCEGLEVDATLGHLQKAAEHLLRAGDYFEAGRAYDRCARICPDVSRRHAEFALSAAQAYEKAYQKDEGQRKRYDDAATGAANLYLYAAKLFEEATDEPDTVKAAENYEKAVEYERAAGGAEQVCAVLTQNARRCYQEALDSTAEAEGALRQSLSAKVDKLNAALNPAPNPDPGRI